MAVVGGRNLTTHLLASPDLANSKRFRFARFSPAHPRTRCAHWPDEKFPTRSTGAHAIHVASSNRWSVFLFRVQSGTTFSRGRMFVLDSADHLPGRKGPRLLPRPGLSRFVCRRCSLWS